MGCQERTILSLHMRNLSRRSSMRSLPRQSSQSLRSIATAGTSVTARGYTELKRTDSNSQAMADPEAREAMLAEVEALIDARYDGWIVRPITASLVLARRL